MKKVIAIVLSFSLIVTMIPTYTFASFRSNDVDRYYISESDWLELSYIDNYKNSLELTPQQFEIKEYHEGKLAQVVTGELDGDTLTVTNYQNNEATNVNVIQIAERITADHIEYTDEEISNSAISSNNVGSVIGYITFNPVYYESTSRRISIYSNLDYIDNESYTINGAAQDTLAVITGLLFSALGTFLSQGLSFFAQMAISLVSSWGGSVTGNAIGIAFTESVGAWAYHYTLTGCDYTTNRYTYGYEGVSYLVATKHSDHYNEWFYEGYNPETWKSNHLFHSFLWNDLWPLETYPQVKSFT